MSRPPYDTESSPLVMPAGRPDDVDPGLLDSLASPIQTGPVVSPEERHLLAGDITGEQYIRRSHERTRLLLLRSAEMERAWRRRLIVSFSAAASVVYLVTAVVFLLLQKVSASVAALLLSTTIMLLLNVYQTVFRSDGSRQR